MPLNRELDVYSWLGATACIAGGLFALWIGIDSVVQFLRGEMLIKDALQDLPAIAIGLGFLIAALDIVRPTERSRLGLALGVAFWPIFAIYVIGGLVFQPLNAPNWGRLGVSVPIWTAIGLLYIGWSRLTEPRP